MTASRGLLASTLLLLAALPMAATAVMALGALFDAAAWRALWSDPLWLRALGLSLWTGLASTALAWGLCAALLAQGFVQRSLGRLLRALPVMLATPHAAFAIGLVFLVSPSGWLLRALSPWLTGFEWPPAWPTTQDPWGLGLIVALVAKEVPFLLWTAATQLQRDDVRARWRQEHALAQTLGYSPQQAWWRVVWPQLASRLRWPLLAVLAYGLTVVDMALIIGPASPPTLAVLAWQWLQDASLAVNAQGAAAAGLLALVVLAAAPCWLGLQRLGLLRARLTDGVRGGRAERTTQPAVDPEPVCPETPCARAETTSVRPEPTSVRPEPVEGLTQGPRLIPGLRQAQPERWVWRDARNTAFPSELPQAQPERKGWRDARNTAFPSGLPQAQPERSVWGRPTDIPFPQGRRQARPERGVSRRVWSLMSGTLGWWLLGSLYAAVLLALAVGSVAGVWPFPAVWPEALSTQAWQSVWASRGTVGTTLWLAAASAALALVWSVAWLECAPRQWDAALRPLLYLPLVLPAVLWVVGLYGLALWLHLEGLWPALLLAHTLMVLPYVLLSLAPAYSGFDPRYRAISDSLGRGQAHFLLHIKWPLLRRALAASAAVGFAVSMAQYLPTLYLGAGRWATVTTEAVNLAAGAQRSLTSAYAGLQFVLPVLGFGLAAWVGRARRFTVGTP